VYLHLFDWHEPLFAVPPLGGKVRAARALKDGTPIKVQEGPGGGAVLEVPAAVRDPWDTVIAVDLAPASQ
jgi:hypothetical protein